MLFWKLFQSNKVWNYWNNLLFFHTLIQKQVFYMQKDDNLTWNDHRNIRNWNIIIDYHIKITNVNSMRKGEFKI